MAVSNDYENEGRAEADQAASIFIESCVQEAMNESMYEKKGNKL